MNSNYKLKCPHCGINIERDDAYDLFFYGENCVSASCVGHCPNCDSEYQWEEEYELKLDKVTNFEEVS